MDPKRLILMLVLLVAVVLFGWLNLPDRNQQPLAEKPAPAGPAQLHSQGDQTPVKQAKQSAPGAVPLAEEEGPAAASAGPTDNPPAGDQQAHAETTPGIDSANPPAETADEPADSTDSSELEAAGPIDQWYVTGARDEQEVTIGSVDPDGGFKLMCRLTNVGAAVTAVELTEHFVTVEDKRLYESDPAGYDTARQANPDKYRGRYTLCRQVTVKKVTEKDDQQVTREVVGALATGEVEVWLEGADDIPPLELDLSREKWRRVDAVPINRDESSDSATFLYTIHYGREATDDTAVLRIYKTFTVNPEDYSIAMSIRLECPASCRYQVRVGFDQAGPTGLRREDTRADNRRGAYGWSLPEDQGVDVRLHDRKYLESKMALYQYDILRPSNGTRPVVWVGTTNKYFATLMYVEPKMVVPTAEEAEAPDSPKDQEMPLQFYLRAAERPGERAYLTGVEVGPDEGISISPNDSREVRFSIYAGPKDRSIFADASNPLFRDLYKRLDYLSTIEFACCCPASMAFLTDPIQWLSRKVIWLMSVIAGATFNNYGVAIIVLVLLVRLCLHPLTKKSQVSMMKMQKLQPQIQKLRDKYADDKDALNKEMMRIYKEQGATPLLGCLPMLLQMPILVALYMGINASVQLRHAAFLPVWITDLAAPDSLFSWSKSLPLIGNSFNLLPVLLCVAMFFQTKMNPQMTGKQAASSEQAAQQAKMMKYMMPAMMLLFFYKAASGLTLYFMASTAAGVIDQWAVRRHIRMREQVQAATETTINMPGKAARGHRPKKPKDPFKTDM